VSHIFVYKQIVALEEIRVCQLQIDEKGHEPDDMPANPQGAEMLHDLFE
jgi:hypothetical protein